ncbi:MAG: TSUP family transporter [Alphaproteobacteria bacterium]|nr:TSUP family transporter [Alphaproteobacteria bacterium]
MDSLFDLVPSGVWGLDLAVAAAAVLAAGLIRGFSGFGSAMINAPVLSLLWGPTIGVPVAALVEFVPAIQLTPRAIPHANWRTVWLMGIPALILIPAGSFLLVSLPDDVVRRAVAAAVLILVVTLWSGWRYKGQRTPLISTGVGAVSGLLSGATGIGGPPVILYLMAGNDQPIVLRANMIGYFTIVLIGMAISFGIIGLFGSTVLWRTGFMMVPFIVGIFVGAKLFPFASERTFRNIALTVLAVSATYVILA